MWFLVSAGLEPHDMLLELSMDDVVRGGLNVSLELVVLDFGEVGDIRRRIRDMSLEIGRGRLQAINVGGKRGE